MSYKNLCKELFKDNKVLLISFVYLFIFIVVFLFKPSTINNNNIQIVEIEKFVYVDKYCEDCQNHIKFNSDDIREKSNISEDKLRELLKGTELEELSSSFIKAEEEYNVNAIFLVSLVANNSNWGTSDRSTKYNNMTNMGVYDESYIGNTYSSKEESINHCAKLLSNEYLSENGSYFEGYSVESISKNYCNSEKWINNIINISNNLLK